MKRSKGISILTILLMVAGSVLTLFAAGCVDFTPSEKRVDLTEAPPGQVLTYTLYIINAGDEVAPNTVITDTVNTNLDEVGNITGGGSYDPSTRTITWDLGDIPSGGEMTLTFTARIIPSVAPGTVIPNTASITYTNNGPLNSNTVETTVTASTLDHFEFDSITSPQRPGVPFPVTIYAKDASGATVTSFEGTCDLSDLSGTISPTVTGNFTAGVYSGDVTISSAYTADTITAQGSGASGTSDVFDVVPYSPDLSTSSKDVDLAQAAPAATLTYGIHVINSELGEATQVTVTDTLDSDLENIANISGGGTYDPGEHKITWSLGTVAPTSQTDLTFTADIKTATAPGTIISNQAQIDCEELDPLNVGPVQTEVIPGPVDHFALSAIASPQYAGAAFPLTITAMDAYGNTAISFIGSVDITDTTGTIAPTISGAFTSGVWTGEAVISAASASCSVSVDDGSSHQGTSNTFEVILDTTYPDAEILTPGEGEVLTSLTTLVTGTAYDDLLSWWQLSYRVEGATEWTPLSAPHTNPVQAGELETWDLSGLGDGVVFLKLTVADQGGLESEDIVSVIVERYDPIAIISWPQQDEITGGVIDILGTATDGNFSRYLLSYGEGTSPTTWYPISPNASTLEVEQAEVGLRYQLYYDNQKDVAQTFKVTNNFIDRIEVKLSRTGSSDAEIGMGIFECDVSGVPTSTMVAQSMTTYRISQLTDASAGEWYSFEFRNQQIQPDTQYCYVLYRLDGQIDNDNYAMCVYSGDVYADGSMWVFGINENMWLSYAGSDFTFRIFAYDQASLYGTGEVEDGTLASWNAAETAEGTCTLKLEAEDNYGKTGTHEVVVELDNTAPVAEISSPAGGSYLKGQVDISGTATDDHFSKYQLFYGEGESPTQWYPASGEITSPVTDGLLCVWDTTSLDGLYTLKLRVEDEAGLVSEDPLLLTVDNTPPVATITSPAAGGMVCGTVYVQGTATDDNFDSYSVSYTQDIDPYDPGANWTEIEAGTEQPGANLGSFDTQDMAELGFWIKLEVTDKTGSSSSSLVQVTPDNKFPQVYFTDPSQGRDVLGEVSVKARIDDDHLEEFSFWYTPGIYPSSEDWVQVGAGDLLVPPDQGTGEQEKEIYLWNTTSGSFPDGPYCLMLRGSDGVGHITTAVVQVWVNNDPPVGAMEIVGRMGADGNKYVRYMGVQLKIEVTDAEYLLIWNEESEDTVGKYPLNLGGDFQAEILKNWIIPFGNGPKTVYCQLVDRSGFSSEVYEDAVCIDPTAPNVNMTEPSDLATINNANPVVHFALTASDPKVEFDHDLYGSGLDRVEILCSGGDGPYESAGLAESTDNDDYVFDLDLSNKPYGHYSFLAKAYDVAGNVKASSPKNIRYSPVSEWPMQGYDTKNSHYNTGIESGGLLLPLKEMWRNNEHLGLYSSATHGQPIVRTEDDGQTIKQYVYSQEMGRELNACECEMAIRKIDTETGLEAAMYHYKPEQADLEFRSAGMAFYGEEIIALSSHRIHRFADGTLTDPLELPISNYTSDIGDNFNGLVVSGDFIYITVTNENTNGGHILALRADDLSLVWDYTAPGSPSRPIVADGKVFFCDDFYLYVLNASDGQPVGTDAVIGSEDSYPKYMETPTYSNGRIYVKTFVGYDDATPIYKLAIIKLGEQGFDIYAQDGIVLTESVGASTREIACANEIFYATCPEPNNATNISHVKIYAFDANTGYTLWSHDITLFVDNVSTGAPSVADSMLFVTYLYPVGGDKYSTDLLIYDAYSGNLKQQHNGLEGEFYGASGNGTPTIANNKIIFNYFSCGIICFVPENYDEVSASLGFDNFCGFYDGVNTSLGSYTDEVTDVSLPGRGIDIECKRTYNSHQPVLGPMGYGWDFSYNVFIYEDLANNKVYVANGDGSTHEYTRQPDGTFTPPSGVFDELIAIFGSDPCYILNKPGNIRWEFKRQPGPYYDGLIDLARIVDDHTPGDGPADPVHDNVLELTYKTEGVDPLNPAPWNQPRLIKVEAPGGRSIDISWDEEHQKALIDQITLPGGKTVVYTYDGSDRLISAKDIYNATTVYGYGGDNRLASIIEPEQNTLKIIAYDDLDRVDNVTDGLGKVTTYAYMPSANMTTITDPDGYSTTHRYDSQFRLVQESNNAGDSTRYSYGDDGNGKSVIDPEGRVTEYISQDGKVTQINKPDGGVYKYEYDDKDRVIKETNENGNSKTYNYNQDYNYLESEINFAGYKTEYRYTDYDNNPGMVTCKISPQIFDGSNHIRPTMVYEYYDNGDLKTETLYTDWNSQEDEPQGSVVYFNYYEYDEWGRKKLEQLGSNGPAGPPEKVYQYTYEDDASDDGKTSVTKNTTGFQSGGLQPTEITVYDRNGRLIEEITSRGDTSAGVMWIKNVYEYDATDRERIKTLLKTSENDPFTTNWDSWGNGYYDKLTHYTDGGLVKDVRDHSGRTVYYEYDNAGRQSRVWDDEGLATTFEYFRDGQLKRRVDPLSTGEVRFGYDAAGRQNEEVRTFDSVLFGETVTYTTRKTYDKRGNVTAETVVRVNPDDPGSILYEATMEYYYDQENHLTMEYRTLQPGTLQIIYLYDGLGNKIDETHSSGAQVHWYYNAQGKVTQEIRSCTYGGTGEKPTVTHYTYDTLGNVKTQTVCDDEGSSAKVLSHTEYEYNGLGKVYYANVAIGAEDQFDLLTYDDVDEPGYGTLAKMRVTAFYDYFCDGLLSSEHRINMYDGVEDGTYTYSSPDQYIYYSYDPFGKKTYEKWDRDDGDDLEKTYTYDADGNLLQESVGFGSTLRTTRYEYDGSNRMTKKIVPQAASEGESERTYAYEYSEGDRQMRETDPEGRVIIRTFDDLGREVLTEGPGDYYAVREYDEGDNLIEQRIRQEDLPGDDSYETTKLRYDNLGNKVSETIVGEGDAVYTTTYIYDLEGNPVKSTSPLGYETLYSYDTLSRLRKMDVPYSGTEKITTEYRYDALSRKTLTLEGTDEIDATRFTYDGLSRLGKVEQWTGPWNDVAGTGTGTASVTTYRVDLTGNFLRSTDANEYSTYYSYNSLGLNTQKRNPVGEEENYSYNLFGEMVERTYVSPEPDRTLFFTYDGRGRLTAEGAKDEPSIELARITYAYDYTDNLISVSEGDNSIGLSYEPTSGRLSTVTADVGEDTYQTSYQYLHSGELKLRQTEAGATLYTYDIAGRLTTIDDSLSGTYALSWYDDFRPKSLALPASLGHIDYTYYEDGQTYSQIAYQGTGTTDPQASYEYEYNDRGRRESMTVSYLPQGSGEYGYGYDSMGRLTSFDTPGTDDYITYAYDKVGNLETKTVAGIASSYAYDAANRISTGPEDTGYFYDSFGNLDYVEDSGHNIIENYDYDSLGRLVQAETDGQTVSFTYDPMKRLHARSQGSTNLSFRYDGISLAQTQELADSQIASSYALTPDGTHLAQQNGGDTTYLGLSPHTDVSFTLDEAGALSGARLYDPYGGIIEDTITDCSLGYQEDYTDPAAGLVWMGARWYSPELTRFLTEDPLKGELEDPPSLNPYLYCKDDPVNAYDPTGQEGIGEDLTEALKTFIGAIVFQNAIDTGKLSAEDLAGAANAGNAFAQAFTGIKTPDIKAEQVKEIINKRKTTSVIRIVEKILSPIRSLQERMDRSNTGAVMGPSQETALAYLWIEWAKTGFKLDESPFKDGYPSSDERNAIWIGLLALGDQLPSIEFPDIRGNAWISIPTRVDLRYSLDLQYNSIGNRYQLDIYYWFTDKSGESEGSYNYTYWVLGDFYLYPKPPEVKSCQGQTGNIYYYNAKQQGAKSNQQYIRTPDNPQRIAEPSHYLSISDEGAYPIEVKLGFTYYSSNRAHDYVQMVSDGVNIQIILPTPETRTIMEIQRRIFGK